MTRARRLALLVAAALGLAGAAARADDDTRAERAREATVGLDLPLAHAILDGAPADDAALALERARLALYEGDYDAAVAALARPDLARTGAGAELASVALGAQRATAGTLVVRDDARGVIVRLQDDADAPLVPLVAEVAARARDALARDLGVELPRPLHVELVRDLFSLAAMTGLPETAAQTTGTVAIAKWGRVTMVSPRAVPGGYPWADTLAHEMTHLAETRASLDRAPLWLQEGVAKRQETRWRAPRRHDDFPRPDVLAAIGFDRGLGRPFDRIGGSIALLPSADEAGAMYAQVSSFVGYWVGHAGDRALAELLARLRTAPDVDAAMRDLSGASMQEWTAQWRGHLAGVVRDVPPELVAGAKVPHAAEIGRAARLATLLGERDHHEAAAATWATIDAWAPRDARFRAARAAALVAAGRAAEAAPLVARPDEVHPESSLFYAEHARGLAAAGDAAGAHAAREVATWLDPLDPRVACDGLAPPAEPGDPLRRDLCRAARTWHEQRD